MAYIMLDYMKMDIDTIIAWCKEHNQVEWLKAAAAKKVVTADGKERNITFIELKREFALKFVPEIVPVAKKEKKPSMFDKIAAL